MQAASCDERLSLLIQTARDASRFVIIWHEAANQNFFSPSVVYSAMGFPLYQLGHLYKTRRDRTGSGMCGQKKQIKRKENNECTNSLQNKDPLTSYRAGADRRRVYACASARKPRVRF
jgi:hypothetical protein